MINAGELNELIEIAELGMEVLGKQMPYQLYGLGPNALAFANEAARKHKEILERNYDNTVAISNRFSYKTFSEYVISIVRKKKVEGSIFSDAEAQGIQKYFDEKANSEIQVWREIYGIEMKNTSRVQLGGFTIIDWEKERQTIEAEVKYNSEVLWMGKEYQFLIGVKIIAGEFDKAYEIADEKYALLENITHLVMGNPDTSYLISIQYSDNGFMGRTVAYSNELGMGAKSPGWKRYLRPIQIDDAYFQDREFKCIFELITKENINDLEKRILLASNWIGQALRETRYVDGYLKAIIATEILFSANKEGVITPSITYQISESIAMILGKDTEMCIKIEKEIKELYGKRSSIVHNGSTSIGKIDFLKACEYARAVVFELLFNPIYKLVSLQDLYALLKRRKYSSR